MFSRVLYHFAIKDRAATFTCVLLGALLRKTLFTYIEFRVVPPRVVAMCIWTTIEVALVIVGG